GQLPLGADDVGLGAAGVLEAQQAGDGVERQAVAEMQREDHALGLVERGHQEGAQMLRPVALLGQRIGARVERRGVLEHLDVLDDRRGLRGAVEKLVPDDRVEPGGEARRALVRVQMPVRLEEDVLREIGRGFALAGEAQRPAGHPLIVAREELVDRRVAFALRTGAPDLQQILVGPAEPHRSIISPRLHALCPRDRIARLFSRRLLRRRHVHRGTIGAATPGPVTAIPITWIGPAARTRTTCDAAYGMPNTSERSAPSERLAPILIGTVASVVPAESSSSAAAITGASPRFWRAMPVVPAPTGNAARVTCRLSNTATASRSVGSLLMNCRRTRW